MYKYLLESINQINWLAIIPLLMFFSFFCVTVIQVMRKKKSDIQKLEQMPLND